MNSTPNRPIRNVTLTGFLIVAGIFGTLALMPWAMMLLLLWVAGFQIQALLAFVLYIVCYLIVGFILISIRPGKGLSAGFGG